MHDTAEELRREADLMDGGLAVLEDFSGWHLCRACNQPISRHEPGEYDDECPYFVPSGGL